MQNKIDAVITVADREKILSPINQIFDLLPFKVDLTPEERRSLVKMGDRCRPFVEPALNLVEQDNSFMPRSFDKTEMRQDSDLYTAMLPVMIQDTRLYGTVDDTLMHTGNDLILAGLEIYSNAKENGTGENLDNLVPLLGNRFKRKPKTTDGNEAGGSAPQA